MWHVFTILSLLFIEQSVMSAIIDQRQTGDLNVQIDLKNLQIVGLMKGKEEYVEYDYAYDYSEMTIKPPNGTTTKKPLNVTETATSDKYNTTSATTLADSDQTTSVESIDTKYTQSAGIVTSTTEVSLSSTSPSGPAVTLAPPPSIQEETGNSTSLDCKKGFFRNSQGNCELKLENPSIALLKMIKQKVKMNSSNGVRQP